MFGGVKKCDEQLKIDSDFIQECKTKFKTNSEAVKFHLDKGWEYYYYKQFEESMKRFNQAWLLDSTNADVYWGFGTILGNQLKFEESLIYFEKSLSLNPNNSNVWVCLSTSNGQLFFETKKQEYLDKSIINLKKAISLDDKNGDAYSNLTACYTYFEKKDSALKYFRITDSLFPDKINQEVRKILSK